MRSETTPLLQQEKNTLFDNLLEICTAVVFDQYDIEKFSDKKKATIINYFLDKIIKRHSKMLKY